MWVKTNVRRCQGQGVRRIAQMCERYLEKNRCWWEGVISVISFPESVWAKGSSRGGLYFHHIIFSSSHPLIFTSAHIIFSSSHLLFFTSAHIIFTSFHVHICTCHLHICASSHLLIFTSSVSPFLPPSLSLSLLFSLLLSPPLSSSLPLSPSLSISLPLSPSFSPSPTSSFYLLSLGRGRRQRGATTCSKIATWWQPFRTKRQSIDKNCGKKLRIGGNLFARNEGRWTKPTVELQLLNFGGNLRVARQKLRNNCNSWTSAATASRAIRVDCQKLT